MQAQYQGGMTTYFVVNHQPDSALIYAQPLTITSQTYIFNVYFLNGAVQAELDDKEMAALYFKKAVVHSAMVKSAHSQLRFASIYIPFLLANKNFASK